MKPSSPEVSLRSTRTILLCASAAAAAWVATHLAIQLPRGWPYFAIGEWDVLLLARAIEAGDPPTMVLGSVHGYQVGSWLVGAAVALLLTLGVPILAASKIVAVSFGATTAALCAGSAAALCRTQRAAVVTAVLVGVTMAGCWPAWHLDLSGLTGATPESVPFQLAALLLALFRPWGGVRSAVASGIALAIAWLFSPATLWVIALSLLALCRPLSPGDSSLRAITSRLTGALGALSAILFGVALVLPEGFEGMAVFLSSNLSAGMEVFLSWNVLAAAGGAGAVEPVGLQKLTNVLSMAPQTLAPIEETAPSLLRRAPLLLGGAIVATPLLALWQVLRARRLQPSGLLALAAATWVLPLSGFILPEARYFVVPMCLGLLALATSLGHQVDRAPESERLTAGLCALIVVLAACTLGGWFGHSPVPADSFRQSLLATGAHSIAARTPLTRRAPTAPPGPNIDSSRLLALLPHTPEEGRVPLLHGFGLDIGSDPRAGDIIGREPWLVPALEQLGDKLTPAEYSGLLVGAGCGLVVNPVTVLHRAGLDRASPDDLALLSYGMGLCAPAAELQYGCPVWPSLSEAFHTPRSLEAFAAGLRDGALPASRLDEAPEAQQALLRDVFVRPAGSAAPAGAPAEKRPLDFLPPRPGAGCTEDWGTEDYLEPFSACPEIEPGQGSLAGTVTRSGRLHEDGVGALELLVFDTPPFGEQRYCLVARASNQEVDLSSANAGFDFTIAGIPTRPEPYFIAVIFDDNSDIEGATGFRPGPGDLVDLRGEALAWPAVVIPDRTPVPADFDVHFSR